MVDRVVVSVQIVDTTRRRVVIHVAGNAAAAQVAIGVVGGAIVGRRVRSDRNDAFFFFALAAHSWAKETIKAL